jgi:hypothetical protein
MNEHTRGILKAWRDEIAAGIPEAVAKVETAQAKLQHALRAEADEKARVDDLRAAVAGLPNDQALAVEIANRVNEAAKAPAGMQSSRAMNGALEAAEFALQDKREALAQLDTILAPAAPARPIGTAMERGTGTGLAPFEPVQMPAARMVPAPVAVA